MNAWKPWHMSENKQYSLFAWYVGITPAARKILTKSQTRQEDIPKTSKHNLNAVQKARNFGTKYSSFDILA